MSIKNIIQNTGGSPLKKLYLNRCFTTTSQLIEQLHQNPLKESFELIISHSMPNHYLESKASHFEIEPTLEGLPYVGYILNNLKSHAIDLFLPRYQVTTLIKHAHLFEKLGVPTMFVTSDDMYQLIDNKVALYDDLKDTGIIPIPETHIVSNLKEFQDAYESIREQGWNACYKPIQGIGGEGFKRIRETIDMTDELFLSSAVQISKQRVEESLSKVESVNPFMMSGFMEGDEYSIDCLAKDGQLILAIPRRKVDKYRQNLECIPELIQIAQKITKQYNMSYLFNIQVKYHNGIPYLIEMNTRTSGGLYKAHATGVNMMYEAIRLLQGKEPMTEMKDVIWNVQTYDHLTYGVQPIQ
jgi:hypothetical protein